MRKAKNRKYLESENLTFWLPTVTGDLCTAENCLESFTSDEQGCTAEISSCVEEDLIFIAICLRYKNSPWDFGLLRTYYRCGGEGGHTAVH